METHLQDARTYWQQAVEAAGSVNDTRITVAGFSFGEQLEKLLPQIDGMMPSSVCQGCGGTGTDKGQRCFGCVGTGWIAVSLETRR